MSNFDILRLPTASDPTARSYKDWLHLNVFDLHSGLIALINVSLHGSPHDGRSRAVGVALATIGERWVGGIEIAGQSEVTVNHQGIMLETMSLAVASNQRSIHAAIRRNDDRLNADVVATPAARPVRFDLRAPFGSGWISWWALPLLRVSGEIRVDGQRIGLNNAIAYHDHNWGRWHWGDDAGWEWGAFAFPAIDALFVFARASNKAHDRFGLVHFSVELKGCMIAFAPDRVVIELGGTLGIARRIPGALAAIHTDRRKLGLPAAVFITANDGTNSVQVVLNAWTAAQLILSEPTQPGYSFINEIAGSCTATGKIGDFEFDTSGLGVFEYVE